MILEEGGGAETPPPPCTPFITFSSEVLRETSRAPR